MKRTARDLPIAHLGALLGVLALLPACGGGGGSGGGGSSNQEAGLTLAITDAVAEELTSFTVSFADFRLERKGGAEVGVLAAPIEVDLVTLTDLSEILEVMSVPQGVYVGATATFDFTGAVAIINGSASPATLLDDQGNPLTGLVSLPLQFGKKPFKAVKGVHKLLELDFDLDQSLVVDPAANTVEVEPVLVLRIDPTSPKELRAGGTLASVDAAASLFTTDLGVPGGPAGPEVEFLVGAGTVFQINGVPSVGTAGLAALETAGIGTWTEVYGAIDPKELCVSALYVEAGTGTHHGGSDFVDGIVTARSGGVGASATLSVHGHSANAAHTAFLFNASFSVATSFLNTKVVRRGSAASFDLDDVNVGQHVRIFGSLAGTNLDASTALDVIRLHPTRATGFANADPSGTTLPIDLTRVGWVPSSAVTWADGGSTPPDPDDFVVEVGGLANGLGLATGSAMSARGFMAAVDDAGADMNAISLTNLDSAPAVLMVRDRELVGFNLTITATPGSIELDLSGQPAFGEVAFVNRGLAGPQALPFTPTPALLPSPSGKGHYLIKDKTLGSTGLYLTFSELSDALAQALAGGATVRQVTGVGAYDSSANTLSAGLATMVLK